MRFCILCMIPIDQEIFSFRIVIQFALTGFGNGIIHSKIASVTITYCIIRRNIYQIAAQRVNISGNSSHHVITKTEIVSKPLQKKPARCRLSISRKNNSGASAFFIWEKSEWNYQWRWHIFNNQISRTGYNFFLVNDAQLVRSNIKMRCIEVARGVFTVADVEVVGGIPFYRLTMNISFTFFSLHVCYLTLLDRKSTRLN